jgi:hypothetical protein
MTSARELLNQFENEALDAPLGEEGAEILDQLERVSRLCTELKDFYKAALAKDPNCVPGWTLKPGAARRSLADPAKVWERVSDTLSSEQFMAAITIRVTALQEIWSRAAGVPGSQAKAAFDELLADLMVTLPTAPSLLRTSSIRLTQTLEML